MSTDDKSQGLESEGVSSPDIKDDLHLENQEDSQEEEIESVVDASLEGIVVEPEVKKKVIRTITKKVLTIQSPIPPPSYLPVYEQHYPGSAKALLDNYLEESKHRRSLEKASFEKENELNSKILEYTHLDNRKAEHTQRLGMLLAAILAVFLIALATFCITKGHLKTATAIIGSIVGVVGVSVFSAKFNVPSAPTENKAVTTSKEE